MKCIGLYDSGGGGARGRDLFRHIFAFFLIISSIFSNLLECHVMVYERL